MLKVVRILTRVINVRDNVCTVLVHLHGTGSAPACPPHWLVCTPPPSLTLSEQCSGSVWQKGPERDVVFGRAVTSVCTVVDREICVELLLLVDRCDRMKLSLWTCRSKNSWVLYSYREVSETFHIYFTLKCEALKIWHILRVYLLRFILKIQLFWDTIPRCVVCIYWRFESS